jgi:hypothetical protein
MKTYKQSLTRKQKVLYTVLISSMLIATPFVFNYDIWLIFDPRFGDGFIYLYYVFIACLLIGGISSLLLARKSATRISKYALFLLGVMFYLGGFGFIF